MSVSSLSSARDSTISLETTSLKSSSSLDISSLAVLSSEKELTHQSSYSTEVANSETEKTKKAGKEVLFKETSSKSTKAQVPFEIFCEDPTLKLNVEQVFQDLYSKEHFGFYRESCSFILDAFAKISAENSRFPFSISIVTMPVEFEEDQSSFSFLDRNIKINKNCFHSLGNQELMSVILYSMTSAIYLNNFNSVLSDDNEVLQEELGCTKVEYEESFSRINNLMSMGQIRRLELYGYRPSDPLQIKMLYHFLPEINQNFYSSRKGLVFSSFLSRISAIHCLFGKSYSSLEINEAIQSICPLALHFFENNFKGTPSEFPFKISCDITLRSKFEKVLRALYAKESFGVGKEACSFVLEAFSKIATSKSPISISVVPFEQSALGEFCFFENMIKLDKETLHLLDCENMESEPVLDFMGTILHEMTHAIHFSKFKTAFNASEEESLQTDLGCTREMYIKSMNDFSDQMPQPYCHSLEIYSPRTIQEKIDFHFIDVKIFITKEKFEIGFTELLARIPQVYALFGKTHTREEIDTCLNRICPLAFQFFWNQFQTCSLVETI